MNFLYIANGAKSGLFFYLDNNSRTGFFEDFEFSVAYSAPPTMTMMTHLRLCVKKRALLTPLFHAYTTHQ